MGINPFLVYLWIWSEKYILKLSLYVSYIIFNICLQNLENTDTSYLFSNLNKLHMRFESCKIAFFIFLRAVIENLNNKKIKKAPKKKKRMEFSIANLKDCVCWQMFDLAILSRARCLMIFSERSGLHTSFFSFFFFQSESWLLADVMVSQNGFLEQKFNKLNYKHLTA